MKEASGEVEPDGPRLQGLHVAVIALVLVACTTALPILAHPYVPLVDLPNHIARHFIAANASDPSLATYYSINASIVPNSAVDMLWRFLGFPAHPVDFARAGALPCSR